MTANTFPIDVEVMLDGKPVQVTLFPAGNAEALVRMPNGTAHTLAFPSGARRALSDFTEAGQALDRAGATVLSTCGEIGFTTPMGVVTVKREAGAIVSVMLDGSTIFEIAPGKPNEPPVMRLREPVHDGCPGAHLIETTKEWIEAARLIFPIAAAGPAGLVALARAVEIVRGGGPPKLMFLVSGGRLAPGSGERLRRFFARGGHEYEVVHVESTTDRRAKIEAQPFEPEPPADVTTVYDRLAAAVASKLRADPLARVLVVVQPHTIPTVLAVLAQLDVELRPVLLASESELWTREAMDRKQRDPSVKVVVGGWAAPLGARLDAIVSTMPVAKHDPWWQSALTRLVSAAPDAVVVLDGESPAQSSTPELLRKAEATLASLVPCGVLDKEQAKRFIEYAKQPGVVREEAVGRCLEHGTTFPIGAACGKCHDQLFDEYEHLHAYLAEHFPESLREGMSILGPGGAIERVLEQARCLLQAPRRDAGHSPGARSIECTLSIDGAAIGKALGRMREEPRANTRAREILAGKTPGKQSDDPTSRVRVAESGAVLVDGEPLLFC